MRDRRLRGEEGVYFGARFVENKLKIIAGIFCWNGIILAVRSDVVCLLNPRGPCLSGTEAAHCPVGIKVGRDPLARGAAFAMPAPIRLVMKADGSGADEINENEIALDDVD